MTGSSTTTAPVTAGRSRQRSPMSWASKMILLTVAIVAVFALPGMARAASEAANIDQCANGGTAPGTSCPPGWQNGDLNASNSHYAELDSVPFRVVLTNLTSGSHTFVIQYDAIQGGKHAYDYLTSFGRTVSGVDPCDGVAGCAGAPTLVNLPLDPRVNGAGWGGTPLPQSLRQVAAWNVSGLTASLGGASDTSDQQSITFTFTSVGSTAVLAWGGHIGSQINWGAGNAAGNISGSPYHMRVIALDGAGGNQDRSMKAAAITPVLPGFETDVQGVDAAGNVALGVTVHDQASLTGTVANGGPSGSVQFTVCGPDTSNPNCATVANNPSQATLSPDGIVLVSGSNGIATSAAFTPSAAGHYCFRAIYTPDAFAIYSPTEHTNQVTETSDAAVHGECFTVAAASPTIATTLSASSPIAIGATVHDSSTLTGATAAAGGTVAYSVYSDSNCSNLLADLGTKSVTNHVPANSDNYTAVGAGDLYFKAVYSGDANNGGATSTCTDEHLVVSKASPSISTTLSAASPIAIGATVHDSSTLTDAAPNAGGTVAYTVYSDSECQTQLADLGSHAVTNGVPADSSDYSPTNAGDLYFKAVYSGDTNNNGATSACTDEHLTVSKASPSISTLLSDAEVAVGGSVNDSATLHDASSNAGGQVTYTVYNNADCSTDGEGNSSRDAGTVDVTNGSVPNSDSLAFDSAGDFYWQAVYSGDANNDGATSPCISEHLSVGKASPSISTLLSESEIALGDSVNDSATLDGATSDAGGQVSYTVYNNASCSTEGEGNSSQDAGTVDVTNGDVPDSDPLAFNSAGDFYWQAVYTGDANNNGATSPCESEHLVVDKASPSISTELSSDQAVTGSDVHDSAVIDGATSDAGGQVTYSVYNNANCSTEGEGNTSRDAGTVDVTDGNVPDSNALTFDTAGDFYWQAVYTGDANNNGASSSCEEEHLVVSHPAISITKNPKSQSITTGGTANFTITVTNTGDVALSNVAVTDAQAPDCAKAIGDLAAGATMSYDCALTNVGASFTNSATATGHPAVGADVSATDTAPVTVNAVPPPPPPPPPPPVIPTPPAPKIDLQITKADSPDPDVLGSQVRYLIVVKNNGPDTAHNVQMSDPLPFQVNFSSVATTQGTCAGGQVVSCQLGTIANGASVTVTVFVKTTVTGLVSNTATTVGQEAETNTANNTASTSTLVKGPFKPPVVQTGCYAVAISPHSLTAGKRSTLKLSVHMLGKPAKGAKVRVTGAGISKTSGPTNAKGIVKMSVKPAKPGILRFQPVAHKGCALPRIGVLGAFTPPVTG